ncbi:hypothetical protein QBC33DRAFT_355416 [Phialemonium atrogriseum]|uniref:Uncharacterized protein n=1 Tax=Phialemonium atrogriseum TaxID=1093897 RepID=A0AAJ0C2F5_9PEZI|nr:uncharacterized protein QBC33DRAFT_355416 [Phialemonium atrogriseum]KAK1768685.1 hypothetical protein QBC33DRAFT_355416 [Phialemonium atrogriseum]
MPNCYCANYYGSVHCRNMVSKFGDRCKLCLALKSGASLSEGLLPQDELWMVSPRPMAKSKDSSRSSSGTTRSSRIPNH